MILTRSTKYHLPESLETAPQTCLNFLPADRAGPHTYVRRCPSGSNRLHCCLYRFPHMQHNQQHAVYPNLSSLAIKIGEHLDRTHGAG